MRLSPYSLASLWNRRWWRPDPTALAAYQGLRPMVVVTGASEGIGLAFAAAFVREGRDVLAIARSGADLEAAVSPLRRLAPTPTIEILALDLTSPDCLEQIDAKLAALGAYADVVVNNAGVGLAGRFVAARPARIEALIALNIGALTKVCRHVLPGQLVRGRGGLINVGSIGAYVPAPQQAVYYASKAYVVSFGEALAAETAGRGVRVTTVVPGPVDTQFHAKMGTARALYRRVMPSLSPDAVARRAIIAHKMGIRVVVPGVFDAVVALALRVLPHRLTVPICQVLLRPL